MKRCPTCGQRTPLPVVAVRICFKCGRQIVRHDKWVFEGSRIRHRHCDNPGDYYPPDVRKRYDELHAKGKERAATAVLEEYRGRPFGRRRVRPL